jgi:pimeloyl-ACP methyl ester carboxylesterase
MQDVRDFSLPVDQSVLRCRWIIPATSHFRADGPYLVFLHEALGCVEMWKAFPERLCRLTGLPGLLYDRQGHGASDPLQGRRPLDYLNREAEEVLPDLLRQLHIERPVLIGHSDGGTIALLFAAAYPDWPCCAMVEAAHVFVDKLTRQGIRAAISNYHRTHLEERLAKYHAGKSADLFRAWSGIWLSDEFASWNMLRDLPSVRCPLLVVQGEADEYGTREQVDRITNDTSGPATPLLIPQCGHIPHLEAQDRVLEAAEGFLRAWLPEYIVCNGDGGPGCPPTQ